MMVAILPFPEPSAAMPLRNEQVADDGASRMHDAGDAWGALMARAQDGDKIAYRVLLNDIAPYLRAIAGRYLGRGEDAEDAVQEILMIVHDIRHTYEPGRPFKPWLGTIATRRCIDLLRRRLRRIEHELLAVEQFGHVQDASPGPEENANRAQQATTVRNAVADLSPRQREAVGLVHLKDMSLYEASIHSKQSVGSIKVACHRALKALKHALDKGDGNHD